ncbi:hypothetical protein H8959_013783 [Pygathrix nigripes]
MLAAKTVLAIRYDAFGEDSSSAMGVENRAKLEARLRTLEDRGIRKISGTGKALAKTEKYEHKSEVKTYDPSGDSTLPTCSKKRKIEQVDKEDEITEKKAKKAKIKVKVEEEEEEEKVAEEEETSVKKKKKKGSEYTAIPVRQDPLKYQFKELLAFLCYNVEAIFHPEKLKLKSANE